MYCYFYKNGKLWKLVPVEETEKKTDKAKETEKVEDAQFITLPSFEIYDAKMKKTTDTLESAMSLLNETLTDALSAVADYEECSTEYKKLGGKALASKKSTVDAVVASLRKMYADAYTKINACLEDCETVIADTQRTVAENK